MITYEAMFNIQKIALGQYLTNFVDLFVKQPQASFYLIENSIIDSDSNTKFIRDNVRKYINDNNHVFKIDTLSINEKTRVSLKINALFDKKLPLNVQEKEIINKISDYNHSKSYFQSDSEIEKFIEKIITENGKFNKNDKEITISYDLTTDAFPITQWAFNQENIDIKYTPSNQIELHIK